jgi:tetratricopeptide (TPR) repeat protein
MKTIFMLCALSCAAASVFAQTASLDQVSQDPNKGVKSEQSAALAEASAQALATGTDVTFEQVLGSPDDIELNERYALALVRKGDLRGAATTLERVLLIAPGRVRTRLLYGIVLLRLDDAPDARRELDEALASPDLPADARPDAEAYRKAALSRLRDSHFDARLTLGGGYDSNRNAAPNNSQALFLGNQVTVTPGPTADGNFQFVGSVGASYDFDGPRGDTLFARFTDFRQDQSVVSLLSLQVYTPQIGATFRTPWVDITPSYSYSYVDLSIPLALYMRGNDYDLRFSRRWSRALETSLDLTDSRQVFYNTPLISNGSDRSGDQFNYALGATWTPTPADRVALTLLHQRKFAVQVFDAYRREGVTLDYTRLFPHSCFALIGLTANYDRYEQPDQFVAPVVRSDDGYIPHLAVGAPLDPIWSGLKGFTGTLGFQYQFQNSSVMNYRYSNAEVNALISYQWGI